MWGLLRYEMFCEVTTKITNEANKNIHTHTLLCESKQIGENKSYTQMLGV